MKYAVNPLAALLRCLIFAMLFATANTAWSADMVPYLQTPTANSIWVSWKTATAGDSVVEYGGDPENLASQATGSSQQLANNYFFHGVQLTGLSPDSYYYYRIKTGNKVSAVFRFCTQPTSAQTSGKFRILVAGDHQIIDQDRHLIMMTAAKNKIEATYGKPLEEVVNLMINDGDQVDVGTLDHYENLHFRQSAPISKNVPIMTTVGNHETYYDPGMTNWKAHFFIDGISYKGIPAGPDERYYANQVGRVLFIHLDSEATSTTQLNWVRQVMTAADVDSTVDWVISVIHRPYQAEQYVGDISAWLRDQVMPVLSSSRKHVLNIAGHHHLYARGQTRDYPTYHMISGGNAWDQYWGQSTENDFDDVQKTIANWTWQLIEIDLATKELNVQSFSEAHPKLGFVYTSKLTDEFHRKLNKGAPNKPSLTNSITAPINLPYTFTSSAFQSTYGEALNTTQFQFARDAGFNDVVKNAVRDFENLYGDSGAPAYTPVDINAGIDLLRYQLPQYGLPNGSYYARVRHRDKNVEWSPWSESVNFTVQGSTSGNPTLSLSKSVYAANESVQVNHVNGTSNPKDWIGIYQKGQVPGGPASTKWSYVNSPNGTNLFSGLVAGTEYFVGYFSNDGYTEIAPRVNFYVGSKPTVAINKNQFAVGENVIFNWTNAPGKSTDWIGVYRIGQVPGQVGSTVWSYTPTVSGSKSFNTLSKGYYFATFMVNDGYFEIIDRINFSVGDQISTVSMANLDLAAGEDFDISFINGPGIAKDYLGVFKTGATPGVDKLVSYAYVDGKSQGSVRITEDLPNGSYFVALYTNDSYTEVSNRVAFTVGGGDLPPPPATLAINKNQFTDSESISLNWANTPGGASDWIGIYPKGQTPGNAGATAWKYAIGTSGSLGFSPLLAGEYFAAFMINDGYTEITPRVNFKVIKPGDINGDGLVNVTDRDIQRAAMGSCFGDARYVIAANFDSDSCITQNDYKLWYAIFKKQ